MSDNTLPFDDARYIRASTLVTLAMLIRDVKHDDLGRLLFKCEQGTLNCMADLLNCGATPTDILNEILYIRSLI